MPVEEPSTASEADTAGKHQVGLVRLNPSRELPVSMLYMPTADSDSMAASANERRTDPLGNRKEGPDDPWVVQTFEQGSALGSVFPRPA